MDRDDARIAYDNMERWLRGELLEILEEILSRVNATYEKLLTMEVDLERLETVLSNLVATNSQINTAVTSIPAKSAQGGAGEPTKEEAKPYKTVYTFHRTSGEGISEDARFTASGFETAATLVPERLFYFSEDTASGDMRGSRVPGYYVYTGATKVIAPTAYVPLD